MPANGHWSSILDMSSSEAFPPLAGTVNVGSTQDYSDIVSTGWYTPGTVCLSYIVHHPFSTDCQQYAYHEPFMTQYPTSSVDNQSWSTMSRQSIPDLGMHQYSMVQPQYQYAQLPQQVKDPSRPRSSPSTFGPGTEHMAWPMGNGLGIWSTTGGHPTPPTTSTFPPSVFQTYAAEEQYAASSTPEIRQPIPKRPFTTIAPNPEQVAAQKRKREEEEQQEGSLSAMRKRKRTSSVASADLSEDDRFLVQLKEDELLPWKDIAKRFESDKGKNFQVAALQMRYKRLREKLRTWEDKDISALKQAHDYWEKYKWEIISLKVSQSSTTISLNAILTTPQAAELTNTERWPARHCAKKWQELETPVSIMASMASTVSITPAMTHYSSPIEGTTHFGGYMPHMQ